MLQRGITTDPATVCTQRIPFLPDLMCLQVRNKPQRCYYQTIEIFAFKELLSYIRNELIPNPKLLSMTDPTSRLQTYMSPCGTNHVNDSTKKHLRRKLETELEGALHIFSDDKGKLILYPDSLKLSDLAKEKYSLKKELEEAKPAKSGDAITKGALQWRNDIKKQDISQVWTPDMENSVSVIPESVTMFLHTLLVRDCECANPSERVRRLATSFESDLVYAVTCGKTPKHILLPFAVKSLTGNTELIQILNRLGHSLSYLQIEEVNTALCLQKLERSVDDVQLPGDIYPFVFTTLA